MEDQIKELKARIRALEQENELLKLKDENDSLRVEVARLKAEVERLKGQNWLPCVTPFKITGGGTGPGASYDLNVTYGVPKANGAAFSIQHLLPLPEPEPDIHYDCER